MNATSVLVRVDRGEGPDVVELIDASGTVLLIHAHGVDDAERARTREAVLRLLRGRLALAEGRSPDLEIYKRAKTAATR